MKKLMMVLLIAMVGVCFADYKTDFGWNLTDSAKIEKGLAEATQAKDLLYMDYYSMIKAFVGKDAQNITYDEYKNICKSIKLNKNYYGVQVAFPVASFWIKRLNPFMVNIANDKTLTDRELNYVNTFYYTNKRYMFSAIEWRKRFVNIDVLMCVSKNFNYSNNFFKTYKKFSIKYTLSEIKDDTALMKRVWYDKMIVSDAWKQLLVQVELMNKSVQ